MPMHPCPRSSLPPSPLTPALPPRLPFPPPGGEALDYILMEAFGGPAEGGEGGAGGQGGATGFINQVGLTLSGLQRFMRSLSQ